MFLIPMDVRNFERIKQIMENVTKPNHQVAQKKLFLFQERMDV